MNDKPNATELHRKEQGLSYRDFAKAVNEKLINTDVSFSKVHRWETKKYEPDMRLLFECIATYRNSWIAYWAVDNISEMFPDLVQSGIVQFHLPRLDKE